MGQAIASAPPVPAIPARGWSRTLVRQSVTKSGGVGEGGCICWGKDRILVAGCSIGWATSRAQDGEVAGRRPAQGAGHRAAGCTDAPISQIGAQKVKEVAESLTKLNASASTLVYGIHLVVTLTERTRAHQGSTLLLGRSNTSRIPSIVACA